MSLLDVSLDVSAVPLTPAGAGRYTIELARALGKRDDLTLQLIARRGDVERMAALGAGAVVPAVPNSTVTRLGYERLLLGRRIDRLRVDVHHGPHYTMPTTRRTPVVVTIHDLTFFDRPEVHEAAKVRFFRHAIERAARKAGCLVCVSQRTADDLARNVAVEVPVVVATHGIDHDRFKPTPPAPGADAAELELLGLDPQARRIVALGTLEPRKGVTTLIAAATPHLVAGALDELVLAGQRGWGVEEIDRAIESSPAADRIVQLGYVRDDSVPALLRSAAAVAYPSLDEGFGLPALEALACGCPLITTAGSVMADLCGDAPWLVEAGNADALSEAIAEVLGASSEELGRRRELGLAQAAPATWATAAARHVEAYKIACGQMPPRDLPH